MHGESLIMAALKGANTLLQCDRQTEFSRLPVGSEFLHTHPCKARYVDSIPFIPFILIAWDSLYTLSRQGANTNVAYQRARSAQHYA